MQGVGVVALKREDELDGGYAHGGGGARSQRSGDRIDRPQQRKPPPLCLSNTK